MVKVTFDSFREKLAAELFTVDGKAVILTVVVMSL